MTIEARFRIVRGDFTLKADLNVPTRGITAVFGPSGCGKTTLLRAIAGFERDRDGYLKVGDAVWQENGYFMPPHRRAVGFVFQEPSLFTHLNVQRNIEYGNKRVPEAERRIPMERAIELLGIGPLLERRPDHLSGGERQRVAIARALAANPGILLMDEPLAALDMARKLEILPYLESLRDELDMPVIYVSHALDEVARLADHLAYMEGGRVLSVGPIGELLTRLNLPLAYREDAEALIEARVAAHDEVYHLTYLDFPGGRFSVLRRDLPLGHLARLRIVASDVSITTTQETDTSILNIFPATVQDISADEARVMVRLLVGGVPILSRVTRKSAILLALEPGKRVYAQIKSAALLV